ncbi:MAG: class I SAM-dependent RNA methyltransferase [Pseudomonadota bacterium]
MTSHLIERLGAQGDGATADGVFAPFSLPGEEVSGDVEDGRIAAPKIVAPSADRVAAPCRHFRTCGGCALQHASDPFVAAWKRDQIALALSSRGMTGFELRETATSPARSRRRAVFAARRTKKDAIVGFHGRRSDEIVAITECRVIHPNLMEAVEAVRAAALIGASRKGALRATATVTEGGVDLALEGGKALEGRALIQMTALAEAHDLTRLTWEGEVLAMRRPPALAFGEARVVPPPGGFLQATAEGEAALLAAAREALGDVKRIADLFAGCGTFSIPLASRAEVHGVEGDKTLLAALTAGANKAGGLKRITTEARDLFRRPLLAVELKAFDGLVIDPPRAGAAAQTAEIAEGGPPVIAAISCNPATFARDARALIDGGYRLDWVAPVDQFRWSPHVELAARFSR